MEFEIWQIGILIVAAFLGGFIDAIAGGGGLICLPALMAVGIPVHVALATNKLQGSFGTFASTITFTKKGYINFKDIYLGIIFTFLGTVLGVGLVLFINDKFLKFIIPFLLIGIVFYTIFSPNLGEIQKEAKMNKNTFFVIFGFVLGFYDGFFGPGTGSFWTFSLMGILGYTMKNAVANTKVLNFTSNIAALIVFTFAGEILWKIGILMGIAQMLGSYIGSNLVIKKDVKFIKTLFLAMVVVTILKIFLDIFKNS
ncbi:TSUP family transporter [Campylobacter sp. FMV-PI01]|uniref:Probable membrane transporter protein n=1 Tax=Campylobacter portucalensis TaxID=2608384 RepID=A0A6L5WJ83_9BACT|nr:TSUP family transporter [Campylobacter portucalensis]MSN97094.1 TSUP family transporter [Campylobacter portucalensis]